MRMPTSRTRQFLKSDEAGFTLIELLAVLAVLAIAITAFTYGGSSSLETSRFRAFMIKTSAEIRQSRADAMRSMEEKVVLIDLRQKRIGDPKHGAVLELPDGVELDAEVAASETFDNGIVGIRFYPAGHSSGGTLIFRFRNQAYEIRVNWLTGNVATTRV